MVRILLAAPWKEERGGVTTVVEDLAAHLQKQGNTVLFFHPSPTVILRTKTKKSALTAGRLRLCFPFAEPRPIVSAVAFVFLFPIILLQLIWYLRTQRIGIVNLHYPIDNFFYFGICRRLLPIRLVTSIHGSDAFTDTGMPKKKYSRAFKFVARTSDVIILPSETYRKRFLEVFEEFEEKTIFIHNGVDPGQFSPSVQDRNSHRYGRYILCIAHLKHVKGIDVLLRASKPLLVADACLKLVLVGDGPQRDRLEALASELGIQNQTNFVGVKQRTEVAQLLLACEVFVLPSRTESFGLVIVEALACRKAVVATAVGAIPEIIENEKSGILVEPDNPGALTEALARVLANDELKRTLGENGYSRMIDRFCFDRTAAEYVNAFASSTKS